MDIVGKTFNHLTILEYAGKNKYQKSCINANVIIVAILK